MQTGGIIRRLGQPDRPGPEQPRRKRRALKRLATGQYTPTWRAASALRGRLDRDALRGVARGRRNSLFADAGSSGDRAAAMYGLIGTAKLNGVAPQA
jgi:hypothetical protein